MTNIYELHTYHDADIFEIDLMEQQELENADLLAMIEELERLCDRAEQRATKLRHDAKATRRMMHC